MSTVGAGITSPAAGHLVASRKPGEVVRRYSCRRTGEGAGIERNARALTRARSGTSPEGRGIVRMMRTKPPTDPIILDRARRMRREMTEVELKLWSILRNRDLVGVKFRRQVPIGNYIADFCCLAYRLIVELDGGQHAAQEAADASRSRFLSEEGFRILRFWNDQVLSGSEFVVAEIVAAIIEEGRAPSPDARGARRPLPREEV
jgi:very-short-patch-repair endonuclease